MSAEENFSNSPEGRNDIENADSFEALYEAIRVIGEVQGTRKRYTPEQLIKAIEQVRHGHSSTKFITRSHSIRDAVDRLLPNDKIHHKYTKGSRAKKLD